MNYRNLFFILLTITLFLSSTIVLGQNKDGAIFAPDEYDYPYIYINSVSIEGNTRTKNPIIVRELDFKIGDSLSTRDLKGRFEYENQKRISKNDSSELVKRLKYSRENIINTKLFLTVDLKLIQVQGKEYRLDIVVQERWYFWVFPVIRIDAPNFNEWLKAPSMEEVNMGIFTSHNNMLGLGHQASLIAYFGNSQMYGLGYYIPWIGDGQRIGLRMGAVYSNSGVVEYGSVDNERQMLYQRSSLEEYMFLTTFTVRPGLYNYGKLKLTATTARVSDSMVVVAPDYLPDGKSFVSSMNLYIDYVYDSRNNKSYPLKGTYLKGFLNKKGLGIISHDVDYFYYGLDFHFYQQLSERFYVAEMVKAVNSSSEDIAYHFKQNLTSGDDFIRGYDYFALRGDEMYYFRGNLKYMLVKPSVRKPKRGNQDSQFRNVQYAFYLNFFSDVAYMTDDFTVDNPLNNELLYTWGVGIDLISYYDLVLRFEYAFTSIRTSGFYFGFGMPI